MTRLLLAALALAVLALSALPAAAAPALPGQVSFQGRLTDAAGNPFNGDVSMIFSVYASASGGPSIWSETQSVHVSGGLYSVLLGSQTSLDSLTLDMGAERWLGIQVGTDPEMTPRYPLTGTLFSRRSAVAERALTADAVSDADTVDGFHASAFAPVAHGHDASTLTGILPVANGGTGAFGFVAGAVIFSNGTTLDQSPAGLFWDSASLRLGVGTGAPSRMLHVAGDGRIDGTLRVGALEIAGDTVTVTGAPPVIPIPDNSPPGVTDSVVVPDLGTATSIAIAVRLTNSNVTYIQIELTDPDGTHYILAGPDDFSGTTIDAVWPPNYIFSGGDLSAWNNRNPQGTWTLKVIDGHYLNNDTDGQIDAWSVIVHRSGISVTGAASLTAASGTPPLSLPTAYAAGATVTHLSADLLDGKHAADMVWNQSASDQSGGFRLSGTGRLGHLRINGGGAVELTNSAGTFTTQLSAGSATVDRFISLPDTNGTVVTTGNLWAITATGTVASGTWNGSVVAPAYGGTGLTGPVAAGRFLRGSSTTAWAASTIQASDLPAGSGNYIQNQTAATQSASFKISGSGIFGTDLTVNGNAILGSDAKATLTVNSGPVNLPNALTPADALVLGGDATLYRGAAGPLTTDSGFTVGRSLTVVSDATIDGNLTVNGNTTLGNAGTDTLTVNAGAAAFPNATTSTSALILGIDTNLYRSAANMLRTDDSLTVNDGFIVNGGLSANGSTYLGSDSADNVQIAAGKIYLQNITTSTNAMIIGGDTEVYRPSSGTLQIDDHLNVKTNLDVGGTLTVGPNHIKAPIAYATIASDGTVSSGSPNVTCVRVYEDNVFPVPDNYEYHVTITGVAFSTSTHVSVVTPNFGGCCSYVFPVSGGKMGVRFQNFDYEAVPSSFSFILYRP
jgi:subtilisin-like proprotein convertase family protein